MITPELQILSILRDCSPFPLTELSLRNEYALNNPEQLTSAETQRLCRVLEKEGHIVSTHNKYQGWKHKISDAGKLLLDELNL